MADREDIGQGLEEVRGEMAKLYDVLSGRVEQEVQEKAVPREVAKTVLLVAVLVAMLTLVAEHAMITRCFLDPPQAGTLRVACGAVFPGYSDAMAEGDERLAKFGELLAEVPRNKARVERLEAEVAKLKE